MAQKKKFPHALIILLSFFVFSCLLAYVVPQGQYERVPDEDGYDRVVQDSYQTVGSERISFQEILLSIPEGIVERGDLIALIFLLGGCFYVIEKTGVLNQGINFLVSKVSGKEEVALIIVSLVFATGGVLTGLQEEIIGMIPVLLLLARKLGYNSFVALGISFGSAIIGGAFSPMNPFAVLIGQKTAGVALLSGLGFRIVFLAIALAIWIFMIIRYGNRNRIEKEAIETESTPLGLRGIVIFGMLISAFVYTAFGLLKLDWGFNHMSALFFIVGMLSGLIGGLGLNKTAEAYIEGFKELTFAALLLGFAYAIPLVLQKGIIIDSIVYGLFMPLQYLPTSFSAVSMMLAQMVLHYPVPSYSGQAMMTMPILGPLSDLIGMSRQVAVLAYQYGAVMMDLIVPTNGALMAVLVISGITYDKWFKFIWRLALVMLATAAIILVIAVAIDLQ